MRRNHPQNPDLRCFWKGVLRMPYRKGGWTEDDIAKLKAMAGKEPGVRIAQKLGRTLGAVAVEASKLGLSLRTRRGQAAAGRAEHGSE
jgi:hypothetical protein